MKQFLNFSLIFFAIISKVNGQKNIFQIPTDLKEMVNEAKKNKEVAIKTITEHLKKQLEE